MLAFCPVPVFVASLRCLDRWRTARWLVESQLGSLTGCMCRFSKPCLLEPGSGQQLGWRVEAEHAGAGLIMNWGLKTVDILDFLLGPLSNIQGDAVSRHSGDKNVLVETMATATFRFAESGMGLASWNFVSSLNEDILQIDGVRGRLTMSVFGDDPPVLEKNKERLPYPTGALSNSPQLSLLREIVEFARQRAHSADTSLPQYLPTGEVALRANAVMDAVLRTFYRSRTDDFWTRTSTWRVV